MKQAADSSRKIARSIKEAARRQFRKENNDKNPDHRQLQVMIQLNLNHIKAALKEDGFQVF